MKVSERGETVGPILLCTLNARYAHASLALRWLRANLGQWREASEIHEYTLGDRATEVAERLIARNPVLVAFSVYIWNVTEITRIVRVLRAIRPELPLVVGGPEVSHDCTGLELADLATVVAGPGERVFPELCRAAIAGEVLPARVDAAPVSLPDLQPPYDEYTPRDLEERVTYVEASRGCVFRCAFCLSALDKTATPFPLDPFLDQLRRLRARGARHFKFVDRTFNLVPTASAAILQTILDFVADGAPLLAHFEVVPDRLPEALFSLIAQFPAGTLQLELGFQTFDAEVQRRVDRRQDDTLALANLVRLRTETGAHLHTDLVFGLPGETLESFAGGFDRLFTANPHEIQVGILKRLRGAPIGRCTHSHAMVYDPEPPYAVWSTSTVPFETMVRVVRFSRYWDLVGNSGRFVESRALLCGERPFWGFLAFSDWLFGRTGQTHGVALDRLVDLVYEYLVQHHDPEDVRSRLSRDYARAGARGSPRCLDDTARRPAEGRTREGTRQRRWREDR